jgi:hypothetical protein
MEMFVIQIREVADEHVLGQRGKIFSQAQEILSSNWRSGNIAAVVL